MHASSSNAHGSEWAIIDQACIARLMPLRFASSRLRIDVIDIVYENEARLVVSENRELAELSKAMMATKMGTPKIFISSCVEHRA